MRFWANLVGYQLVWFAIVISVSRGQSWRGIASALLFVALQFWFSASRLADARALVAAFLCGFLLDGALAGLGLLHYASPVVSMPAPIWILSLWLAFAMTLNHSMSFLRGRPGLAALLGGIGGPLAYLSAARGFNAIVFTTPAWHAIALLAIGWAIGLALLVVLSQRWVTQTNRPTFEAEHVS